MIELHAEAPKIIVPLFARTLPELTAQAAAAQRADAADLVELRLDPLPRQDWPTALAQVRAAITKPLIVTIRTAREGGEVDPPSTAKPARHFWRRAVQTHWTLNGWQTRP